ncbi:MAG: hypothetical protein K5649_04460 [Lachnospiraceae bacterium]|nr:hypothetical protein [Lachnospiraceae bacterium]
MRIGKCPENAYKRSVGKYLQTGDGRSITSIRQTALTYEMAPAVFLQDAVNEIAAAGARSTGIAAGLIVPPDTEEAMVASVMERLLPVCERENVPLTEVSVKTLQAVSAPVLQVTVTGRDPKRKKIKQEADLLLVGAVAMAGTMILATEKEDVLLQKFARPFIAGAVDFKNHLSVTGAARVAFENGAIAAYSLSEGGIYAGLWEFASAHKSGLEADLKKITIRQESVEIAEIFQINPYQLLSTGAMLVAAQNGLEMLRVFRDNGIEAVMIGSLKSGNDRVIRNDTETRYLDLPAADEIYRIFG